MKVRVDLSDTEVRRALYDYMREKAGAIVSSGDIVIVHCDGPALHVTAYFVSDSEDPIF